MILTKLRDLHLFGYKRIQALTVVFLLLFAGLTVRAFLSDKVYRYEGNSFFAEGCPAGDAVIYENIALPPGVYYVELEFETDTDLAALAGMRDETLLRGKLCTNGEHLYAGNTRTGYHMWLYEGAEHIQAVVSYSGTGLLETGALTITETKQLWTRRMVILAGIYLLILSVMVFDLYRRKNSVSWTSAGVFLGVVLIGLTASLPYLSGGVYGGADLTYHLQRIEGVKDGLLSGQFPVRLEPEWLYGHGYADGVFYCNLFLYLPALFRLAGFTVSESYNVYAIALGLATAWIAWYCFSRIYKDHMIGIVCSGLYTLSVFRICRFVMTATVGEGSAYAFMPLVIYGLYRILSGDTGQESYRSAWVPAALGYAGLIQSHVLSCEIAAFLTLLVCLLCIRRILRGKVFLQLVRAALGAVGLSFWYLVPFADYYLTQDVHIKHVSARTIQERGLTFANAVFSYWKVRHMEELPPSGVSVILIAGLVCFCVLCACGIWRKADRKNFWLAALTALLGAVLVAMSLQYFPWDAIQESGRFFAALVSSLQVPYRVLGWATACLVTVFGFCLSVFSAERKYIFRIGVAAAAVGILFSGIFLIHRIRKQYEKIDLYNEEGMGFGYIAGAEYLIQGTDEGRLTYSAPAAGEGVTVGAYAKKGLSAELFCVNDSREESYVELPLLLYKGYRAFCVESAEKLQVRDGDNHVVRVMLPAGFAGKVKVKFVSPAYWRVSEAVSATAWLIMGTWCCGLRKGMRGRGQRETDRA